MHRDGDIRGLSTRCGVVDGVSYLTWENSYVPRPRTSVVKIEPNMFAENAGTSLPAPLAALVDPDDPAMAFIVAGVVRAAFDGFDLHDSTELAAVVNAARRRYERSGTTPFDRVARIAEAHEVRAAREARSVIYYARLGNRVKIGTTTDLKLRMQQIRPEELLATEPGGRAVERERHGQFNALRTSGEWFMYSGPLVQFVETLRAAA